MRLHIARAANNKGDCQFTDRFACFGCFFFTSYAIRFCLNAILCTQTERLIASLFRTVTVSADIAICCLANSQFITQIHNSLLHTWKQNDKGNTGNYGIINKIIEWHSSGLCEKYHNKIIVIFFLLCQSKIAGSFMAFHYMESILWTSISVMQSIGW